MSAEKYLIHSVSIFSSGELVKDQWVLFDSKVLAIGSGNTWKELAEQAQVVDGSTKILSPALFDTHVHGGGGDSADKSQTGMQTTLDFHASHGTGLSFLSLISAPIADLEEQIGWAHQIASNNPSFLGLHLEGPFISQHHKGAHDPSVLRAPQNQDWASLLAAANGMIRSVTVAAELITPEQLEMLIDAKVTVCLGHTAADYQMAKSFFEQGAKVLTHAFNGMKGIHHRDPGPIPAALENHAVFTELIADGVHVEPAAARLLDPSRVILITDAMAATGMPDGNYQLGSMPVTVSSGIARTESGSLAGSTLTLEVAVKNYAAWIHSPTAALTAAISNPAQAYGISEPVVESGAPAKLLLWSAGLQLEQKYGL